MDCKLRAKKFLVVGLLILFPSSSVSADQTDSKIQEGLNQYQEDLFPEAEKSFSQARLGRPNDRRLDYNLGSSHYKQGKFQEALQDYTQAALEDSNLPLKKNSLYNSGNALFRIGKLKEAETAYKEALTLDPSDMDAKFNLEFVREQLKKKEKQEKDNNKNQSPNQEGKESKNKKTEEGEEDNEKESQPREPPPEKQEPSKSNPSESAKTNPQELSEEAAEQLLGNLSEDLKKISRMQAAKEKPEQPYQSNQW